MRRLVLVSTIFGLLFVSGASAIADTSEREENHIGEGSFENIGENSGHGNFDGNAGLHAPAPPTLPSPPSGLPTLPSGPPSGLPTLPSGPPSGLPTLPSAPGGLLPAGLPALPAPPSGLPTPVSGLPTELPDLAALLASISTPFTLEAPLGLPVL